MKIIDIIEAGVKKGVDTSTAQVLLLDPESGKYMAIKDIKKSDGSIILVGDTGC